ncbi:hypothetical protein [Rhodococcus rhodnii]|uniref:Uncharacterized protein n=1 Tax=Rhodococcus rhodnii LMG 5362 TaxID=1273125 RepID=R7WHL9_9NOCA|nr:hypothetical protein [Rhodococcus rhodnii]EOM74618.1 hypothetical protein Rrhod_4093 [Rhodococcus rhodnii LMG 5362]
MTEYDDQIGAYETADDFLDARREWLEVVVAQTPEGGYDVLLKVDGTYTARDTAHSIAASFARDLNYVLDRIDPARTITAAPEPRQ